MRFRLAAISLLVALAAVPTAAEAAGTISIGAPGNDPRGVTLSFEQLGSPDVQGVQYPVGGDARSITGWSVERVLQVARNQPGAADWLDLDKLTSILVDPPASNPGAVIRLTNQEIFDRGVFGGGRTPVFFEEAGARTGFLKPGMGGGEGSLYRYSANVGLKVEEARPGRRISLTASRRSVPSGGKVTFQASIPGLGPDFDFTWTVRLPSGRKIVRQTDSGRLTVALTGSGTAVVTVVAPALSSYEAGVGSVTVGDAPEPPKNGGQGGSGGQGATIPAQSSVTYASPGNFGSGVGAGGGAGSASPGGRSASGKAEPDTAPPSDGLTPVSGELLDPNSTVVLTPEDLKAAGQDGPKASPGGSSLPGGLPGEAGALLGIGFLLGLGGLIEVRLLSRLR